MVVAGDGEDVAIVSIPSNLLLNLPTRPSSSSDSPLFSVPGIHKGLLVTSRVSRMMDGVGAVVYDVNVDPSAKTTCCGKSRGNGAGIEGEGIMWARCFHGLTYFWSMKREVDEEKLREDEERVKREKEVRREELERDDMTR